jgi:hypothetical protein
MEVMEGDRGVWRIPFINRADCRRFLRFFWRLSNAL